MKTLMGFQAMTAPNAGSILQPEGLQRNQMGKLLDSYNHVTLHVRLLRFYNLENFCLWNPKSRNFFLS